MKKIEYYYFFNIICLSGSDLSVTAVRHQWAWLYYFVVDSDFGQSALSTRLPEAAVIPLATARQRRPRLRAAWLPTALAATVLR